MNESNLALIVLLACLAIVVVRLFVKPIKMILKVLLNSTVFSVVMLVANSWGGFFGVPVGINPMTALVCGLLGIPGLILLIMLRIAFC